MSMQTNSNNTRNKTNKSKSSNKKYSSDSNLTCYFCMKPGHADSTCWIKNPDLNPKNRSKNRPKNTVNTSSSIIEENTETILVSNTTTKIISGYEFILDSGATTHTCYKSELFTSIRPINISIKWGNTSNIIKASGIGNIKIYFPSTKKLVTLENVLYIPELGVNLLSLNLITKNGFKLSFNKYVIFIFNPNNIVLARGTYSNGLSVFYAQNYIKPKVSNCSKATFNTSTNIDTSEILEELEEDSDLDLIDPDALDINSNLDLDLDISNKIDFNLESSSKFNSNSKNIYNNSNNSNKEKLVVNNNTIELLYKRFGHINLNAIKKLKDNAEGVNIDLKDIDTAKVNLDNCIICI